MHCSGRSEAIWQVLGTRGGRQHDATADKLLFRKQQVEKICAVDERHILLGGADPRGKQAVSSGAKCNRTFRLRPLLRPLDRPQAGGFIHTTLAPMFEDVSTLVAVGAALVAALSALYARRQAVAAGRANVIALHESRLNVYRGLVRFRAHISARGTNITQEEVWRFAEIAELSEFYFPPQVHRGLDAVFEQSLKLLSLNADWEDARQCNSERAKSLVTERHELMRATRDECYRITGELKTYLRVGEV